MKGIQNRLLDIFVPHHPKHLSQPSLVERSNLVAEGNRVER